MKISAAVHLGALVAWAASFLFVFQYEWAVNEQYSYGFLVPLLTAYLVYLRWPDRPAATAPGPGARAVFLGGTVAAFLVLIPILIVLEANPEWRMALWAFGLTGYALALCSLGLWGGPRWSLYFAVPLALLLFAIPWPTRVETPLVQQLMRMVTAVTVEALNLVGIYASQSGNLIRLSSSWVGVEEACSGVRSFQSTLMGAYFLGELFRWPWAGRGALIVIACAVSLLLNLVRTLTLALVTVRRGPEAMEVLHDPVGHAVAIGSFLCLFALAYMIHRVVKARQESPGDYGPAPRAQPRSAGEFHWPSWRGTAPLLALVAVAWIAQWAWFARHEDRQAERVLAAMDWDNLATPVEFEELPPATRNMLRYSEGRQARFALRDGSRVTAFFFRWDAGRISAHASVHRPEVCLPAAGFQLEEEFAPLPWRLGPLDLSFRTYEFSSTAATHYVFFGVWDDYPDRPVPTSASGFDRLRQAWDGQRIRGRHGLQLVITGVHGVETARQRAREIISRALEVDSPAAS